MNIENFKKHFHSSLDKIHLNNSGQGLIPDVNRDTAIEWFQRFYTEGAHCSLEGWETADNVRKKIANFIGASSEEISFIQTTASGLSQAAFGIDLKVGDEILTWDQEYPSNFYPWRMAAEKSQAKVIQVASENWQTPAQRILDRVTKSTKVIAISWVQYHTGAVTDLKMISDKLKGSGIWLVADLIQGLGVRPFNFLESNFDIVCSGSHKWLCSGYGAGIMAIKKERIAEIQPIEFGAMTFGNPDTEKTFSNPTRTDASKFEPGSKAMVEIISLGATLDLFMKFGIQNIFAEASRIADRLRLGLKNQGYKVVSPEGPIVTFGPSEKSNLEEMTKRLTDNGVSFAKRGPGVRLSVHAFNRDSDIDRVLKILN